MVTAQQVVCSHPVHSFEQTGLSVTFLLRELKDLTFFIPFGHVTLILPSSGQGEVYRNMLLILQLK